MTVHLYLSFIPEALIASMLPPEEFGDYYAVGTHKKRRGEAMFAELDPEFRHPFFPIEEGLQRCVAHDDGRLKKSVYLATYRVLEHIPLETMRKLYLVTAYGEVLGLDRGEYKGESNEKLHLYQEIAPIHPLVVSTLNPLDFFNFLIQDESSFIHLPAVSFVELSLGNLARDPEFGEVGDLPYSNIPQLRESLLEVVHKESHTKMVNRMQAPEFPYRAIKNGIFIGNTDELAYFPLPSRNELRSTYYNWWRSANL